MNLNASIQQPMREQSPQAKTKACVSCGTMIPFSAKFCPECGFNNQEIICSCGTKLAPGMKFCPECGTKIQ